ncbi:hypothetical protein AB0M02_07340 [Actinoplanes sp. NPDC051861]|uniref:hypothetical protein n=1 Tax=Actinoplanes sp. NPDC051861 TaxID=3155170 RepID=UPI003447F596
MRKSVKRAVIAGTALAVVAGGATAAYAQWLANGSGKAHSKAGTAVALETVEATPTKLLYPGVTADSAITISNDNPYPVNVTTVSLAGSIAVSNASGECHNTGVYFGDFSESRISKGETFSVNFLVPANSDASFTLPKSVHMTGASQDGCQGASFSFPVSLQGASAAE